MLLSMMRVKLHGGTITGCDLHYEGSIAIDQSLLDETGLLPSEKVHVWNVTSGSRVVTYVIPGRPGEIAVNGAAAHKFEKGDGVIIASFARMPLDEAKKHKSVVAILTKDNKIDKLL